MTVGSAEPLPGAVPADTTQGRPSALRVWASAARPKTLLLGVTPVVLGAALASAAGALHGRTIIACAMCAISIQIATNLFNDYGDFERGADGGDRLGPARAAAQGWLTPRQLLAGVVVSFGVTALFGMYLVARGGWPILALGVASVLCGLAYTGGRYPLAYLGLADPFVFVFFGLVAVGATYYVQALVLTPEAIAGGATLGCLSTAVLVVNNLRDRDSDAKVGKRTLAVRFGPRFARAQYATLVLAPYAIVATVGIAEPAHRGWLLALVSLPLALRQLVAIVRTDGAALNRELGRTAGLTALFAVLLAVGVIL